MNDAVEQGTPAAAGRVPVIAIVGRPNVGKSTLFNRLVGGQPAIVNSQPGVTRDRNIAPARWEGRPFVLVDTGGFEDADQSDLAAAVRAQSALAAEEADAVIAVFDGRAGLHPVDRELVARLRRLHKPICFVANKLDTATRELDAAEFFALGADDVFAVSAAHGRGIDAMLARLFAQLPDSGVPGDAAPSAAIRLALVGRPNVGKSSLLNRLVGQERAIVHVAPGTTRDALDVPLERAGTQYVIVDTAGIRRRPRVHEGVERSSAVRALRALERAELAVLVVDASQGMTDQDARIAGYAWERGRGLLLAINKWDTQPHGARSRTAFLSAVHAHYPTLAEVPAVFVSARTGHGIGDLFPVLARLRAAHTRQLRTVELNRVLANATRAHAPPTVHGKRPAFYYATQVGNAPPLIAIFTNAPPAVNPAYGRYLTNCFRAAFELHGTPLRIEFRRRSRPAGRQRFTPGRDTAPRTRRS